MTFLLAWSGCMPPDNAQARPTSTVVEALRNMNEPGTCAQHVCGLWHTEGNGVMFHPQGPLRLVAGLADLSCPTSTTARRPGRAPPWGLCSPSRWPAHALRGGGGGTAGDESTVNSIAHTTNGMRHQGLPKGVLPLTRCRNDAICCQGFESNLSQPSRRTLLCHNPQARQANMPPAFFCNSPCLMFRATIFLNNRCRFLCLLACPGGASSNLFLA